MMFLFKKKKIHLDCFTMTPVVATDTPIQKSSNFIPDWFKNIPNVRNKNRNGVELEHPTIRGCVGFTELYRQGVIMPLWCDMSIKIVPGNFTWASAMQHSSYTTDNELSTHPSFQHNNHFKKVRHIKITSPWFFKEKTGVKFFWSGMTWDWAQDFPKMHVLTGIINYKYQHGTNINLFFSEENAPYQYDLKVSTPIVQLIPLSERRVEPHIHIIDEIEKRKLMGGRNAFVNSYLRHKKFVDTFSK